MQWSVATLVSATVSSTGCPGCRDPHRTSFVEPPQTCHFVCPPPGPPPFAFTRQTVFALIPLHEASILPLSCFSRQSFPCCCPVGRAISLMICLTASFPYFDMSLMSTSFMELNRLNRIRKYIPSKNLSYFFFIHIVKKVVQDENSISYPQEKLVLYSYENLSWWNPVHKGN